MELDYFKKQLYTFTTENINGYIDLFTLKDKSLLTVGSSSDQVFNAILNGCKDITLLDVNKNAKYYYYLKESLLLNFELEEYLNFLRYIDYPKTFKKNCNVFNKEMYNKIKSTLRLLNYESYLFWDEQFNTLTNIEIREQLFNNDEDKNITKFNKYMNKEEYIKLKQIILNTDIKFIEQDIFDLNINKKFDNIWLSNIATYLIQDEFKKMIDNVYKYLNVNGLLLAAYLYQTDINTKCYDSYLSIYDLNKTLDIIKEYNYKLLSFKGTYGYKFNNNEKDSIILIKK